MYNSIKPLPHVNASVSKSDCDWKIINAHSHQTSVSNSEGSKEPAVENKNIKTQKKDKKEKQKKDGRSTPTNIFSDYDMAKIAASENKNRLRNIKRIRQLRKQAMTPEKKFEKLLNSNFKKGRHFQKIQGDIIEEIRSLNIDSLADSLYETQAGFLEARLFSDKQFESLEPVISKFGDILEKASSMINTNAPKVTKGIDNVASTMRQAKTEYTSISHNLGRFLMDGAMQAVKEKIKALYEAYGKAFAATCVIVVAGYLLSRYGVSSKAIAGITCFAGFIGLVTTFDCENLLGVIIDRLALAVQNISAKVDLFRSESALRNGAEEIDMDNLRKNDLDDTNPFSRDILFETQSFDQTIVSDVVGGIAVVCSLPKIFRKDYSLDKTIADIGRIGNNIDSATAFVGRVLQRVTDFIASRCGFESMEFFKSSIPRVEQWIRESKGILNDVETKRCYLDVSLVDRIMRKLTEADDIFVRVLRSNKNHVALSLMKPVVSSLEILRSRLYSQGLTVHKLRSVPLTISLAGGSQIGKSRMTRPMVQELSELILENEELDRSRRDLDSIVYCRFVEQEYWDGYWGQVFCIIDERDKTATDHVDKQNVYAELLGASNVFPMALHMASIEQKGNTYFRSKAIITTTNIMNVKLGAEGHLRFPEAIVNRFHFEVCVYVKKEYAVQEDLAHARKYWKLDKTKIPGNGEFRPEIYDFVILARHFSKVSPGSYIYYEKESVGWTQFLLKLAEQYRKLQCELNAMVADDVVAMKRGNKLHESLGNSNVPLVHRNFSGLRTQAGFTYGESDSDLNESFDPDDIFTDKIADLFDMYKTDSETTSKQRWDFLWDALKAHSLSVDEQREDTSVTSCVESNDEECRKILRQWMRYVSTDKQDKEQRVELLLEGYKQNTDDACAQSLRVLYETVRFSNILPLDVKRGVLADLCSNVQFEDKYQWYMDMFLPDEGIFGTQSIVPKWDDVVSDIRVGVRIAVRELSRLKNKIYGYVSSMFDSISAAITEHCPKLGKHILLFIGSTAILGALIKSAADYLFGYQSTATQENTSSLGKDFGIKFAASSETQVFDASVEAIMTSIWKNNVYGIYFFEDDVQKTQPLGFGFFSHGVRFHFCFHYVPIMAKYGNDRKYKLVNSNGETHSIVYSEISKAVRYGSDHATIELQSVRNHKDLRGLILHSDEFNVRNGDMTLLTVRNNNLRSFHARFSVQSDLVLDRGRETQVSLPRSVLYQIPTIKGDCGVPIFICDPTTRSKKFFGFHVGGNPSAGVGIAHILSREPFEDKPLQQPLSVVEGIRDMELACQFNYTPSTMRKIGEVPRAVGSSGLSSIRKSPLYGKWSEPLKAPAKLKSFICPVTGEKKNPMDIALSRYDQPIHEMDLKLVRVAARSAVASFVKGVHWQELPRKVSIEVAAMGVPGREFVDGLNRTTSPGYPWCLKPLPGFSGKERFLGKNMDIDLSGPDWETLKSNVLAIEKKLQNGGHQDFYFCDSLKDELVSKEKSAEGRTRLFCPSPIEYQLLFNMYFREFIEKFMKSRIVTDHAVGVNVYSSEWDLLARKLSIFGPNSIIAGDFPKFDANQAACILKELGEVVITMFDDREHDAIRRELWRDVFNSKHIVGKTILEWLQSLCSGHPMTTPINCMFVATLFRLVWMSVHNDDIKSILTFEENHALSTFGDDHACGLSPYARSLVNQNTIAIHMKRFGMGYTDELKTTGLAKDFRSIDEIEFLKRRWRYDERVGRYVAPLRIESIIEMPYWSKKNQYEEIWRTNVQNALKELSLQDERTFDTWAPKIIKASTEAGFTPDVVDYDVLFEMTVDSGIDYSYKDNRC